MTSSPNNFDDQIDLLQLWIMLWNGKYILLVSIVVFALLSYVYLSFQPNMYRGEAILAPADNEQASSSLPGSLGLASSIAGINLDQSAVKIRNAIAKMQSREFIINFVKEHELVLPLFAEIWDPDLNSSVIDPEIYNLDTGAWTRGENIRPPSDWEIYGRFRSVMSVVENPETHLYHISVTREDRVQAAQWVNWLVEDINQEAKQADLQEARSSISYLRAQIESTALVEMQQVFYQLIENQMRTVMLADVRSEYIFQVIDPAMIPEEVVSPRRLFILAIGLFMGGLFGLVAIFFSAMRERYVATNTRAE